MEEGDENTTFEFAITLSETTTDIVSVSFLTAAGEAEAGTDFEMKSGKISIAPGQTSAVIRVTVIGDDISEPHETFVVVLSDPTNGYLGLNNVAVGTIMNDDGLLIGPDTKHIYLPLLSR